MPVVPAHLEGAYLRNSRMRLVVDGAGADGAGTFTNLGPDAVEHSASANFGTPTTVAAGAVSTSISTRRFVRSVGRSTLNLNIQHEANVV